MMETEKLLEILAGVKNCAVTAGRYFKQAAIEKIAEKSGNSDLVTNVDRQTQQLIQTQLQQLPLQAAFVSEEQENTDLTDEYTWIVDPIDGTSNYIFGREMSFVSIALTYKKQTVLACCYNPYRDELFWAVKGGGAYMNEQHLWIKPRPLAQSLLAVGTAPYDKDVSGATFSCLKDLFNAGLDIRRSGSCVADLCYLAKNEHHAFYEAKVSLWDYAAGALIVEEAGGEVNINADTLHLGKTYIMAGNSDNFVSLKAICYRYIEANNA